MLQAIDTPACNGYWGYKPSKRNGVSNTNNYYYASPTTSGETLDTTNDNSNGYYTVSIGARADTSTAIGSYSNTFVLTVTVNPTPYAITYNKNTTDTVSNMPSNVDTTSITEQVALSSTTPTRTGYSFMGWCTVAVADNASCSGTSYTASGTFTLDQTVAKAGNTLVLYAVWGELTMQRVALWGGGLAVGEEVTARDERDNKEYTVARVCTNYSGDDCTASELWMTQNLDLDIGVTGTAALTSVLVALMATWKTYFLSATSSMDCSVITGLIMIS